MYLIVDIGSIAVDGLSGNMNFILHYLFIFLFYFFGPLAPFFWVLLVDYEIFRDKKGFYRRIKTVYIYPILVNTLLSLTSIFNGWFFSVDENNLYMRGNLFLIHGLIYFFYVVTILFLTIKFRKRLEKKFIFSMIMIVVFPTIVGIFQSFFYGLELIWPAMTVSVMIYFFIHQTNLLNYDYLTGLYNRRSLDSYLKTHFSKNPEKYGGIMIDVFRFKLINDEYGHKIGDEVLIEVGKILRNAAGNGDFLCRYAGDEFFIVSEVKEELELQKRIDRIEETLKKYNEEKRFTFKISLSIGGVLYKKSEHKDPDKFISDADIQMYKIKNRQKREYSNNGSFTSSKNLQ
jgi:diguanylate cyclase (GGDEF)-like protein